MDPNGTPYKILSLVVVGAAPVAAALYVNSKTKGQGKGAMLGGAVYAASLWATSQIMSKLVTAPTGPTGTLYLPRDGGLPRESRVRGLEYYLPRDGSLPRFPRGTGYLDVNQQRVGLIDVSRRTGRY